MSFSKTVFVAALIFICGIFNNYALSKPLPKPGEKVTVIKQVRWSLVPKVTGGIVTGKAADYIESYDNNLSSKFLYAAGAAAEYSFSRRMSAGFLFELAFKDIPNSSLKPLKGQTFGIYGLFRFSPAKKSTPFLKGEFGQIKMTLPDFYSSGSGQTRDLEIGTFDCFRIGIGIITFTSSKHTIRTEIYYRTISTDGERVSGFGQVDFNTSYIGLEIAWGIGLFGAMN